jgi:hypothetical protein
MNADLVGLADRLMLIAADVETMTVVLPPVGQRNITARVADLRACADSILAVAATKPAGWIPKWQLNGKPWAWTAHDEESAAGLTGLVPLYLHPAPVNKASGVVPVEEANLVPHVHPERGPGYFFNEALKGSTPATELRALAGAEVGVEPDVALLASMACCLNHGFGLNNPGQQERQLRDMRKLWDEMMGRGFYSPENRERYASMLAIPPPPGSGRGGVG